jgi:hypothetical protein
MIGYELDDWSSIFGIGRNFLFVISPRQSMGLTEALTQWAPKVPVSGVKRPERDVDRSSAEV